MTWLGGALGLAALWRFLRREHEAAQRRPPEVTAEPEHAADPAADLRAKLDEARQATDDRDEYDAAEGQPLDEVETPRPVEPVEAGAPVDAADPRSLDERRRAIHEKAQQALGEMQRPPDE